MKFSLVIPVYNRPEEIDELLESLTKQKDFQQKFEIVVVEDGSENSSEEVVKKYENQLNVQYFFKENTGAGQSRNYGMQRAKGDYFIILDSDCIIPEMYLYHVSQTLKKQYTDAFGGPDAAHKSFTMLQKAINYSMTSLLTTGGIRGKKNGIGKFQLRSFNMGISKKAFQKTKGFSKMKYGEDIDMTFRLWENGFKTQLIPSAYVFHKRRSTIKAFFKQTFNFGTARPILNKKYPESAKLTFWFPSLFVLFSVFAAICSLFKFFVPFQFIGIYLAFNFFAATMMNKNALVGFLAVITTIVQFFGYGLGFLKSKLF
ncbi:glycosyltransferase [Aureivirga sp. CE67]|uniref:glycosyltransferase n=1 Tax=Aureivirga sp. CE67 TaxID=1788983 RepID=UPI0018CB0621|nr:glycosyltransferase [Aureivirga sp. CE67]